MTVCNLWLGVMLSVLDEVMSLGLGFCGLLPQKLLSLTLISLLVALCLNGVLSWGTTGMRTVCLGSPKVRKARRNAADAHEGGFFHV